MTFTPAELRLLAAADRQTSGYVRRTPGRASPGRPRTGMLGALTDEVATELCRAGVSRPAIAQAAGVSVAAVGQWKCRKGLAKQYRQGVKP